MMMRLVDCLVVACQMNEMGSKKHLHLSIFCCLTLTTVLGCQAPSGGTSHYSRSRIRPSIQPFRSGCHISKDSRNGDCTDSALEHLSVRGGASDDDYQRRNYDRRDYDERSRRRPPPPDRPEFRQDDSRRRGLGEQGQGPPRGSEERRRYDNHDDEKNRRYDDRRQNDNRDRIPDRNHRPGSNARNRIEPPAREQRKSWFGSKKKAQDHIEDDMQQKQQPPPPPPPPNVFSDYNPAETERVPINYMFPTAEVAASERTRSDERTTDFDPLGGPDLPVEVDDERIASEEGGRQRRRRRHDDDDAYASPRRDAVTLYMSTRTGAAKVRFGSIVVGAALGSFIGKVSVCELNAF
jgi:hypothetical protein